MRDGGMPTGPRIYNLFPLLAGSTTQWIALLPKIAEMGFDWVYLNPFHLPGFSGSLYAVKDYTRLHPVIQGESTESADELLSAFVRAARDNGLKVMMDLVINHTSKDSLLAEEHPEFFLRDKKGKLVSPSAIDPADANKVTVWGDLAEIDYRPSPARKVLVETWKTMIAHYIELGFGGFRCDAAYQVPGDVWSALIAHGRKRGEVAFMAETLGCRLEQTEQLAGAGFDAFFNSSKWWDFREPWLLEQYESFREVAPSIAFPESHDTPRLVTELREKGVRDTWRIEANYRLRYLFAVFFSTGVMMPMGFETGQRRKLDVVKMKPADLEEPLFDLAAFVAAANRMKRDIPALNEEGPQQRITSPDSPVVGLLRTTHEGSSRCLALINPSEDASYAVPTDGIMRAAGSGWQIVCDTNLGAVEGGFEPGATMRFHPLSMRILRQG
jgi:starch synthase (maltosyl-transferring)